MKILRAIGGFFAKIGRWIAATAWVQPLLIVGGIFGIIFSIPYIKKAFDTEEDTTDYNYVWYSQRCLTLYKGGQADRLLGYFEKGGQSSVESIKQEFGDKFFLTFVKKGCADCNSSIAGYVNAIANAGALNIAGFRMYSVLIDIVDPADTTTYLARKLIDEHKGFLDAIDQGFGEGDSYKLYKNLYAEGQTGIDKVNSLKTSIDKLTSSTDLTKDGFTTPFTIMFDYSKTISNDNFFHVSGITALYFNYADIMIDYSDKNNTTRGYFIRDCWNYQGVFDPERVKA